MPDMGGPSLRDSRSLSLPPSRWQVLGVGLNRSEWMRRPHLWILVLAPSPQSSSRGLGPRRPSDTLQFVDPLLVAGFDAQSLVGSRAAWSWLP
jgi:hypothetical protein